MDNTTLLPCPFCGTLRVHVRPLVYEPEGDGLCDDGYYVECIACGPVGPSFADPEKAARHWNRRKPDWHFSQSNGDRWRVSFSVDVIVETGPGSPGVEALAWEKFKAHDLDRSALREIICEDAPVTE